MFKTYDVYEKYLNDYVIEWAECSTCGRALSKYRYQDVYYCHVCDIDWLPEEVKEELYEEGS